MTRKQRSQRETQAARVGIARAALFLGFTVRCSRLVVALQRNANGKLRTVNRERRTALKPEPLNPLVREWVRVSKSEGCSLKRLSISSRRKTGVARASVRAAHAVNKGVRGVAGVQGGHRQTPKRLPRSIPGLILFAGSIEFGGVPGGTRLMRV